MGNKKSIIKHQLNERELEICIICKNEKQIGQLLCGNCMENMDTIKHDNYYNCYNKIDDNKYKECYHQDEININGRKCYNWTYNQYNYYHNCKICKQIYCDSCLMTHIEYHITKSKIINEVNDILIPKDLICKDVINNILIPYIYENPTIDRRTN